MDDPYESYGSFLQTAIRRYWDRPGSSKVNFLALMLATRHAWGVAIDRGLSAETGKRALSGAAGIAAMGVLIRMLLGGPLGLLLAGASAVSLIAVYGRHQEAVWKKVPRYRRVVAEYETRYETLKAKPKSEERGLMMDGLISRFLEEIDTLPPKEEPEEAALAPQREPGFAEHVARREEE